MRAALPEDAGAVAEIFSGYVSDTLITFEETAPSEDEWRDRIIDSKREGMPFLVTEVDRAIVGYAYVSPWRGKPAYRRTVENSIYLPPDRTGKGIGGDLLQVLLDECEQIGLRQVIAVIADTGDQASVALHRRAGFEAVGRLRAVGQKHGQWVDTVLMQCDLSKRRQAVDG